MTRPDPRQLSFGRIAPMLPEPHLSLNRDHQATGENVAHMMVSDATALHDLMTQHRVRIVKGLRDADFGLRCFVFADPDGNRIDVGEAI